MNNLDQVLNIDIQYRMHAIHRLPSALRLLHGRYNTYEIMHIVVSNESVAIGNLNNFINPAIESGVIHGRALLEFMGLSESSGKLVSTKNKRSGDVGIEDFNIPKVTPSEAVELCKTVCSLADERAYVTLIQLANKGIAHTTTSLEIPADQASQLSTAAQCIIHLAQTCIYTKLGLKQVEFNFAQL